MTRRLISIFALTVCLGLFLLEGSAVGLPPAFSQAHADGATTAVDPTLQQTANAIVPLLSRVTAHHPRMHPDGVGNDPLLPSLNKVLKSYRAKHPIPGIQLAVSLFSESAHEDLTSRTNETWDFLADPSFFNGPMFQTETNYYNGVSGGSYRIYATPFAIPKAYRQQGFKPSLAVFVKLPDTGTPEDTPPPASPVTP